MPNKKMIEKPRHLNFRAIKGVEKQTWELNKNVLFIVL